MDITYLGHSSFRLKTKMATLITDPYDDYVGFKFPKQKADVVTISHFHKDHDNFSAISEVKRVVDGPGEYEVSGVSIMGFPSYHDEKKGAERGPNTIFVFEVEGLRICHLGDLGHKLEEKTLELIGDIDVLMIPVGGEYTIGPAVAAEIVRGIEPYIVLPMHFFADGMDEKVFGNLQKVDVFSKEVGLPVEKMNKLTINKSLVSGDQKIVLLEKK